MDRRLFGNDQPQDHAQVGAEKIAKIRRSAEGDKQAEQIHFHPALCDFRRRSFHACETHAQIPLLLFEIIFQDFLEKFLVTVEQGLMDGRLRVSVLKMG